MTVSTGQHGALPEFEDELELEDEYEGEEFDLGGVISGLLGESELEYEDEYEDEWEGEYEDEAMANPLRRVYPDAMMEHLGHAAAEAETEAEAEAFVGALVPLAAGLVKKAAPLVARATPQLVRGLSKMTHDLRRKPATRQLVRAMPTIAARTTRSLAQQAAHGRHITPRRAIRTLAKQTAAVLRDPRTRHRVVRHARALDRDYHRATRAGTWWQGMPAGSPAALRSLAAQPAAGGAITTAGYGTSPVRYRGVPVNGTAPARYGTPTPYGTPARRAQGRTVPGRGYPRRRRVPAGLSIAWIPVPAWTGRQPPPGAHRY